MPNDNDPVSGGGSGEGVGNNEQDDKFGGLSPEQWKKKQKRKRKQQEAAAAERRRKQNQQNQKNAGNGGGGSGGGGGQRGGGSGGGGGNGGGQGGNPGGGSGGRDRGGKGNGGKGGDPSKDEMRDIAADYGWAWAVFEEYPQLMKVFEEAVDKSWSPQRFVAEIQDTPWFKNHKDVWRQGMYLKLTDPKTYKRRLGETRRQIEDVAGSLGIEFKNRKQVHEMAEQAFLSGWTESKINNRLASMVNIMGKNTVGGDLASTQDALQSFAYANGVAINKPTMQTWLRQIVRGNSTQQEFQQYITKMATAAHPNWERELKAGMTVAEIAEPYRQTMAQFLELNPADINLNSKQLKRALSFKRDDGKWDAMTMTDFEDSLRKDPRWAHTDNARETVNGITASLLQSFGQIA